MSRSCKRNIAILPEHNQPRFKKFHVSSEFIDDEPLHALPLFGPQQLHCSQKLRKDPAGVDIPRKQDRRVHHLSQAHIDKISLPQVDLHGTSRPFDHDDVRLFLQPAVGLKDLRDQRSFDPVVFGRAHLADRHAVYNDLGRSVSHGLKKDRIHVRRRLHPRCRRLHDLRTPHLEPVSRHKRVERHILGLKRSRAKAVLPQDAQDPRCQYALACTGHGALDHKIASHDLLT